MFIVLWAIRSKQGRYIRQLNKEVYMGTKGRKNVKKQKQVKAKGIPVPEPKKK